MPGLNVVLVSALLALGLPVRQEKKAPTAPPQIVLAFASNSALNAAVGNVERLMEKGDFSAATLAAQTLPKRLVRVRWNDAAVPENLRTAFGQAREAALRQLHGSTNVQFQLVSGGQDADLKFSFEQKLPLSQETGLPGTVALLFSGEPGHPWLESVVALHRGAGASATTDNDIFNDVSYSVAQYFGLAATPLVGGFTYHDDAPSSGRLMGRAVEAGAMMRNLDAIDVLKNALKKHIVVPIQAPSLFLDPKSLTVSKPPLQGTILEFSVQLTNTGTGPMVTQLIPDCSCFSNPEPITVLPGESGLYKVLMTTEAYAGRVNKALFILTNDPDRPAVTIPVTVDVVPRYRFLLPEGNVVLVGDKGGTADVYLTTEEEPFKNIQASMTGPGAEVVFEPWQGNLPDPDLNEPSKARSGTHFSIAIPADIPPGRTIFGLEVKTDDPKFKSVKLILYAQKGILAMPEQLFLGEVAPVARDFDVLVSRPKQGFHITSVAINNPHLKATQSATKGLWEHTVRVHYDGASSIGDISATLTIRTDDPKQPIIKVPIQGTQT